jgi:hypothetical protein
MRKPASIAEHTLMTIQMAINKAVEGGYHIYGSDGMDTDYSGANSDWSVWTRKDNESSFMVRIEETFLDPAFWKALGYGLGWRSGDWKAVWHRFIDHLANDKTPELFFESLA